MADEKDQAEEILNVPLMTDILRGFGVYSC